MPDEPRRDLDGKVALVVGGSRNQGAAIAELIASRGATTVVSYANDEGAAERTLAALEKHEVVAEAVRSDARRSAEVDELFAGVLTRHGHLDIVVHTPGAVIKKPLADFTDADFDHLIDLNTRSAFNTLRAAARTIADNGRYVVLSTTLTSIMTGPYGLYSGSKAAVERMVLAAAKDLGARGVTVNAVAPGPIDDSFYRDAETPEAIAAATHHSPRNRLGRPEDVAPVVGWLVGEAAGWVSGQTVRANGAMF
ncbi:3-oxoacyl-[acyl-carrier protein] reductase [Actinacidiphila yanglinensis]|uniref:3-oxoacyl-[acyl-carrier protein] reductase n=1 Tax=Actinacidiphila yanglinensis TaxID=310779 RepID=A0A1H6AM56_9ACTN|nr:SDR family oxidoreductase [Actinacidiphila yanglinensis]SEG49125.1 3-oxoacyl-[acyl-carrier protein] reductase [Actinacidiphila yanglinensis]